ncbi:hypothetical protein GCM10023235_03590 [Kitasatospora terrestris]|uniref:Uncharacterized protein n=1 Tax=Kitasatospora terrestris TaxID=258051 RepID=A0ABP9D957_9ACTN
MHHKEDGASEPAAPAGEAVRDGALRGPGWSQQHQPGGHQRPPALPIDVHCDGPAGGPADSAFTLAYARKP